MFMSWFENVFCLFGQSLIQPCQKTQIKNVSEFYMSFFKKKLPSYDSVFFHSNTFLLGIKLYKDFNSG